MSRVLNLSLTDGYFPPSTQPSRRGAARPAAATPGKRRQAPETTLHIAVVVALGKCLPRDALVFHPRNETNRANMDIERIRGRRMGVMPGVPDLIVIHRGRTLAIELKAPGKIGKRGKEIAINKPTPTQQWAHQRFAECGAPVAVCRSIGEVIDFLTQEGVLKCS